MAQQEQQFQEQGGIATMDPSPIRRWIISKLMTMQASEKRMLKKRDKAERTRQKLGGAHVVEYFHQVDDGYSHLSAQVLSSLLKRYDIEIRPHLVGAPTGHNVAEPELLNNLGLTDAKVIAPHYGIDFPDVESLPSADHSQLANAILAAQSDEGFFDCVQEVSTALWQGDGNALNDLAAKYGSATEQDTAQSVERGIARRAELKHYSSAMFYYAGEWYWGVDRLYHLERRLQELGVDRDMGSQCVMERPETQVSEVKDDGRLTFEIYASLRSPYTAIVFDRALKLAKDTGVNCVVRPVLPMVMRGVPATKEKGFYILFDTAREARAEGVAYGNVRDPIGQPVRNGYALYEWACKFDKGTEFLSNFLRAVFAEGINTNKPSGLKYVVEETGLGWQEGKQQLNNSLWQQELEDNRLTMYDSGLWGVPSFRLLDESGKELLSAWGQDRLWLFAKEIKRIVEARD
ncbi:MAG: 2-hydroxychromene-2-carboxylate isomerase [Alteromonadaceae bacterium]|nr:2-hydroxychromene-2-carboxylate isomerase [Alteromonadaceae bacterium]